MTNQTQKNTIKLTNNQQAVYSVIVLNSENGGFTEYRNGILDNRYFVDYSVINALRDYGLIANASDEIYANFEWRLCEGAGGLYAVGHFYQYEQPIEIEPAPVDYDGNQITVGSVVRSTATEGFWKGYTGIVISIDTDFVNCRWTVKEYECTDLFPLGKVGTVLKVLADGCELPPADPTEFEADAAAEILGIAMLTMNMMIAYRDIHVNIRDGIRWITVEELRRYTQESAFFRPDTFIPVYSNQVFAAKA